jgi:hypothetical protein
VQRGVYPVDTMVTITGYATHDGGSAFFFLNDGNVGPYTGVYVYHGSSIIPDPAVLQGDEVQVTGLVTEYSGDGGDTVTEVIPDEVTDIVVLSNGHTLPEPATLTLAELADPGTAEAYEGSLIRVDGVTVTNTDRGFGEFVVDDSLVVDDLIATYTSVVGVGDTFTGLVGMLHYSFGEYKLSPRYDADFEGYVEYTVPCPGDLCLDDLVAGDLIVTEIMYNPAAGNDDYCEWVEIYNNTAGSVDINGLVIYDDNSNTGSISVSTLVASGGYVVIGKSTETSWTASCVTDGFVPSAFYGTNPALGNSGDQVILDWDTDTADSIFAAPAYAKDQTSAGYSWQLDSASVDVTLGADGTYWCEAVTQINTSTDFGTPAAANDTCF